MTDMSYFLPLIWAGLLGLAVVLYVVLDGFDLGLGILFPITPAEQDRDVMMNTVAPFWDGNETWLVFGGGGLFVTFPLAYAIIMPAFYLPIIIMLLALVFRGVAFEFRWVSKPNHRFWDIAFAWGSIIATFMQGIILGGFILGISVKDNAFAGGSFDWLAPFPIFTGLALVVGYALLACTWLLIKTEGELAKRSRERAKILLVVVLIAMAVVSFWTPLVSERIAERWLTWPNILYLSPVPLLSTIVAVQCWRSLNSKQELAPFLYATALFLLGFLGLAISTMPYMVPPTLTFWQAAAPPSSQGFMLVGTLILLPAVLAYTVFTYWTFRGKVRPGEGYH